MFLLILKHKINTRLKKLNKDRVTKLTASGFLNIQKKS